MSQFAHICGIGKKSCTIWCNFKSSFYTIWCKIGAKNRLIGVGNPVSVGVLEFIKHGIIIAIIADILQLTFTSRVM